VRKRGEKKKTDMDFRDHIEEKTNSLRDVRAGDSTRKEGVTACANMG